MINKWKRPGIRMVIALFTALLIIPLAYAAPNIIDFQGKLQDRNQNPLSGEFNMTFRILNQSTGGSLLWSENKLVNASSGLFSTLLGSNVALNVTYTEGYYLELIVAGETFTPRFRLATAPYSFVTESAAPRDLTTASFIVRSLSGQTTNLTEWRNSTGQTVAWVDMAGTFYGDGSGLSSAATNVSLTHGYNSTGGNWVGVATTAGGVLQISAIQALAENASILRDFANGTNLRLGGNLTVVHNISAANIYGTTFYGDAAGLTNLQFTNVSILYGTNATTVNPLRTSPEGILQLAVLDAFSENASNLISNSNGTSLYLSGTNPANNITLSVNNTFFVNTSGFVGIGTASPGAKLDLQGVLYANGGGRGELLATIAAGDPTWWSVRIKSIDASNNGVQAGDASAVLSLGDYSTANKNSLVTTGKVGIGTTAPSAGLQINTSNPTLRTNGSATFDGFVGIGTTSPASPLHVAGTTATLATFNYTGTANSGLFLFDASSASSGTGRVNLILNSKVSVGSLITFRQANTDTWLIGAGAASDGSNLEIYNTGTGGTNTVNFAINHTTGNVGIGTTTPEWQLTTIGNQMGIISSGSGGPSLDVKSSVATGKSWALISTSTGDSPGAGTFSVYDRNASQFVLTIDKGGKVGINTTSPGYMLHVYGGAGNPPKLAISEGGADSTIYTTRNSDTNGDLRFQTEAADGLQTRMIIDYDTEVGIGTTSPQDEFHVAGSNPTAGNIFTQVGFGNIPSMMVGNSNTGAGNWAGLAFSYNTTGMVGAAVAAQFINHNTGETEIAFGTTNSAGSQGERMRINSSGYVGIGTGSPAYKLEVYDASGDNQLGITVGANGNAGLFFKEGTSAKWEFYHQGSSDKFLLHSYDSGGAVVALEGTGKVGINTTSISEVLTVNGNVSILGTTCRDSGGSATCDNFVDFAEIFPASEPVGSGDVVTIDFSNEGKVVKSSNPYDTAVIGVVSTQPAIVIEGNKIVAMGGSTFQNNSMRPAVALAGRVPVKVTDENGLIKTGDLLTTSSKKGYAMKCTKPIDCVGSVLGIAMQNQKVENDTIFMKVK